jgi:hypothetical protein
MNFFAAISFLCGVSKIKNSNSLMPLDLKKIKSLFIVEDEPAQKAKGSANPEPAAKNKASGSEPLAGNKVSQGTEPGKISDKLMEVLQRAMEEKNLPGLDYLEYRQSLNSLSKMPLEEGVRYQSAFAMAQAMGATPQKLVESANHYLDVLKGEEAKFGDALRKQQTEQIGAREDSLKKLEAALQEKADQIKKLTQEMEQHRQKMEQLEQEIGDAATKLENPKRNFSTTYANLYEQILADVKNMQKYLK